MHPPAPTPTKPPTATPRAAYAIKHGRRIAPLGNSTPTYRPRKLPHAGIGDHHIFMPAHIHVVEEYVKRPQPKPGDAAHVGLGSGDVDRDPSCPSRHGRRSPPLELIRVKTLVKTEEKLRRRCLGPDEDLG